MRSALPVGLTSFVGRERELADLAELLAVARSVTLTGAGGSGKTRLATEVIAATSDRFPDGVHWVDLSGAAEPAMAATAVAGATRIHERPRQDLTDTLIGHLRDRRSLLVLDSCEHLAEDCAALVFRLLRGCPDVTVLATSRVPLALAAETTYRVPPLSVPDGGAQSAARVGAADAARLFEMRAQQVRPEFALRDDNAGAVAEICRRLDGMPLAVELAAARVRVLTPAQIAAALSNRFKLLTDRVHGAPRRHRTLEESVRWSNDLLDDDERLVLARLSVFAGSFALDAARAVAAGDGIDEQDVLDLLTALVDASLVQVAERDGRACYRLLETIRLYARERLAELDDPDRVRHRHLDFFRGLAERARPGLAGPEAEAWLGRLAAEVDDLGAAMDWAVESRRPLAVLDIAEPTFSFWFERGLYPEMSRRLQAAVGSPALSEAARVRGLTTASLVALGGGDYETARVFAARAVPAARATRADTRLVRALTYLAWGGFRSGRTSTDDIRAATEEALALAEQLGDPKTCARASALCGHVVLCGLQLDDGRGLLEQAVATCVSSGLTYQLASAHALLGLWPTFSGELHQARRHARQGVELSQRWERLGFQAYARTGLAVADMLRGDERAARDQFAAARTAGRNSGLTTFQLTVTRWTSVAAYRFGDPHHARQLADEAREVARDHDSLWDEVASEWLLGVLALHDGDRDDAGEHLTRACERSADPPYPFPLGRSRLGLAYLAQLDDDLERAWELAHEGLEVLADYGDRVGTVDALETVAGLASVLGHPDRAVRLLGSAERFRTRTGIGRFPLEAERYGSRLAQARERMDAREAEQCWAEGEAMSVDEAVSYARRGRGERRRPRTGWQSLTPTERDVVRLVAGGCTNAEAGDRLFVSVNTIKTHLSNVYAKVGAESRAELAAEATRRDL